jgi:nucleoside-diphosphate-sugar epimerase
MKVAITGTTSGIGKALKDALSSDHTVVCFDRPEFDLNIVEHLEKIDLWDYCPSRNFRPYHHITNEKDINHIAEYYCGLINAEFQINEK